MVKLRFGFTVVLFLAAAWFISADDKASLRFILSLHPAAGVVVPPPRAPAPLFEQTNELTLAGTALVRFYQVFISPQDIPSCPFDPTCSEYAKQAIAKYGLVIGTIMASDRYQRCNGLSGRFYVKDPVTGRLIDPP